jgi:hypothetical protein
MLVAITNPHQQFPVPLTVADYEFSTSDDGDERGRVTLPPVYARSGAMTQIGDELIVYCTQLSRTIWRGQIERIEEAKDGSITWHALGFGALQRDARISVVQNMIDMTRWQPVGAGFMPGSGYDSRGDLWEYEVVSRTRISARANTNKESVHDWFQHDALLSRVSVQPAGTLRDNRNKRKRDCSSGDINRLGGRRLGRAGDGDPATKRIYAAAWDIYRIERNRNRYRNNLLRLGHRRARVRQRDDGGRDIGDVSRDSQCIHSFGQRCVDSLQR